MLGTEWNLAHTERVLQNLESPSQRLARRLAPAVPALEAPGRLLLEHPRAREMYPPFAAAGLYLTLTMVPLMEAALISALGRTEDPVATGLADYLTDHIPEELHGGAPGRAALDDMEAIGVDTNALCEEAPPPAMAAFIGTQLYWIWHRHPVAILGFLSLEAFHPHTDTVESLIAKTGLPRAGFRQLLLHAKLDAVHARQLAETMDALPLEPWHEDLIALSALQTVDALIGAWLGALSDFEAMR